MELRHLRYFVAVAEAGSLTGAAAQRLHMAQPSLSRQIRDLEYEVGAQLLIRGARGIALTAAGRVFLDHARLALAQVEAAGAAARRAAQPAKPRRAGLPDRRGDRLAPGRAPPPARTRPPHIEYHLQPVPRGAVFRGTLGRRSPRARPGTRLRFRSSPWDAVGVMLQRAGPLRERSIPTTSSAETFIGAAAHALRGVIDGT
jgi:LysR family hca operon transcriptional activator